MPLSDQDHQMLLKHGKELSDHERRITDLNNKMTDTLKSVDESNKYLREQNNRILEAVIRGDEKSDGSNITASINGSTLSFYITNGSYVQSYKGTAAFMGNNSDGSLYPYELLAITSITAY